MKKNLFLLFVLAGLVFTACNDDDGSAIPENAAAFANPAINLTTENTTVNIVFAAPTVASGSVTLDVAANNVVYGTDFTTAPAISGNTITVPFEAGVSAASFVFTRIVEAFEGQTKNVVFTIASVTVDGVAIPDATKTVQLNFGETPILTNNIAPEVGGPMVPNQVFVDLSSGATTAVQRASWDLGFYAGDDFRVAINGAVKMAVRQLDTNDMTQVVAVDNTVAVGEGGGAGIVNGNPLYVDGPDGNIANTAIAEVSATDANNRVYLVNLGFKVSTVAPNVGSVNAYGDARGWRKIRILRDGSNYKLQYANVDATTYQEVSIAKNSAFNFTFFSFDSNAIVSAEPEKAKWDLSFTPFTNLTDFGAGFVSYAFQDFVVTNRKGGTRVYPVLNSAGISYADFTLANVNAPNFDLTTSIDQRAIGSGWRNGGGPTTLPSVRDDRFYILKDTAGNLYKIRFVGMTNAAGERGNPSFEYQKLQ
ncbi:MAG: hypothetical protein CFE23_03510 [Flavobacterium sp. BFFFF1]|uniref:HmuY family protein n=1 Tax=Flavobacterium sp. BFFFF1 TaxID=2015557 RepID=UPI000BD50127|nr:HmuY family protein [Flavobacterium sp. BFFFF1]OYU81547.1 MAG: hypothetical protein CFE23_03510 [Flavobacterium sp. BFFFF1]